MLDTLSKIRKTSRNSSSLVFPSPLLQTTMISKVVFAEGFFCTIKTFSEAESKDNMVYTQFGGPYAEVDYNLTLCTVHSRVDTMGNPQSKELPQCQPNARVDYSPPVRDFGFGLRIYAFIYTIQLYILEIHYFQNNHLVHANDSTLILKML
jgi:hypothetical protein